MSDLNSASSVFVVVGLGNPGARYEKTRHNAGFMFVDEIARELDDEGVKVTWKERLGAEVADVSWRGKRLVLAKPQKYMNLSGEPTAEILGFLKLGPDSLVVAHDEIDVPLGSLKIKFGGGDGGHNGLGSISGILGAGYSRIRLGVGRPPATMPIDIADWVLQKFSKDEAPVIAGVVKRGVDALETLLTNGVKAAQNRFNS